MMNRQFGKILVTGATGLVGSRLLPRLVEAGYDCSALVRSKEVPAGVTPIEGDLFDQPTLQEAVKDAVAIIHLAAVFRSPDTDLIWKSNLEGTRNLINAVKRNAADARFILASTSNVYDADNPHPGREDDALSPQHAYPASKAAAEKELRESGLNGSVLRFPFVYGDGDGHLEELPKHVVAAKFHPAMRMSTIHHRDIYTAIMMALQGIMDGQVVNIADEAPTTLYELLQLVGKPMASSAAPLVNPWHLHVDASLARGLGFRASVRTVHQAAQENLL
ncbi:MULTISPECIES: NAD-dependent epimerase/dehydratase family protein [unclassified Pedobacter]|uniref:NAD-dependent epimerase/dehydratase family protein n=1 Tax=unclassified Pedobacter TaxID=2628915 RepID=UPI0017B35B21|nr:MULTISPECIES: NAD(P)-dependent oxidoreductase [unclassified Pedobacter]NII81040.1 nucleoside-diphosphate-sugar epimerase [Pedobacter sp. SG908]NMN35058.1 nucleoside-diphosphate-sugar epimerase [Pedobacter sp. SG918]